MKPLINACVLIIGLVIAIAGGFLTVTASYYLFRLAAGRLPSDPMVTFLAIAMIVAAPQGLMAGFRTAYEAANRLARSFRE